MGTVDGSLKSGDHQLRLVVYPIIYRVSYIPGGARFQPSTVGPSVTTTCRYSYNDKDGGYTDRQW